MSEEEATAALADLYLQVQLLADEADRLSTAATLQEIPGRPAAPPPADPLAEDSVARQEKWRAQRDARRINQVELLL